MARSYLKFTVYLITMISVPLLVVGITEVCLRVVGYGKSYDLFIDVDDNQNPGYTVNNQFYSRHFSGDFKAAMDIIPLWGWVMPEVKPSSTFRVFVLGGSVALGVNPDIAFNIPRFLEVMLRESFPDVKFEFYNLACVALSSHVMRDAAREASRFSPDLFVVYMGNNEYVGTSMAEWRRNGRPPHADWTQFLFRMQNFKIIQLFWGWNPVKEDTAAATPMEFFQTAYKLGSSVPGRKIMYDNYLVNLNAICESASHAGAAVALCTLGVNLRNTPPVGSMHKNGLSERDIAAWEEHYQAGISVQKENPARALEHYEKALALDDTHAELQFHTGECLYALERYEEARKAFTLACDYDCIPVRADSSTNSRVRQCVQKWAGKGIFPADVEKAFVDASPHGITGEEYFYDPVHVGVEGNYLIASCVFNAIQNYVSKHTGASMYTMPLTYEQCRERLGLSPLLDVRNLNTILEELENYSKIRPEYYPGRYKSLREEMEKALVPTSADNAIIALRKALEFWGDDFQIRHLICKVLELVDRKEEMRLEAQIMLEHYKQWPMAQFTASTFQ